MPIRTALDIFRVPDLMSLRQHWDAALARSSLVPRDVPTVVQAYVSDNRWVADCPECNAGMAVQPEISQTVCLECGARCEVALPPDRSAGELFLLARMPERRHWMPHRGETVEDLARDNLKYMEAN